jgi:hypothetical protein
MVEPNLLRQAILGARTPTYIDDGLDDRIKTRRYRS